MKKKRKKVRRRKSSSRPRKVRRPRKRRKNPAGRPRSKKARKIGRKRRPRPRRRNPEMGSIALGVGGLLSAGLIASLIQYMGSNTPAIKDNARPINVLVGTVGTAITAMVGSAAQSNATKKAAANLAAGMGLYTGIAALTWIADLAGIDPAKRRFAGLAASQETSQLSQNLTDSLQMAHDQQMSNLMNQMQQDASGFQVAPTTPPLNYTPATPPPSTPAGVSGWNPPYPGYPAYNSPRMPWLSTMAGAAQRAGYSVGGAAQKAGYSVAGYSNFAPRMSGYSNFAPLG